MATAQTTINNYDNENLEQRRAKVIEDIAWHVENIYKYPDNCAKVHWSLEKLKETCTTSYKDNPAFLTKDEFEQILQQQHEHFRTIYPNSLDESTDESTD